MTARSRADRAPRKTGRMIATAAIVIAMVTAAAAAFGIDLASIGRSSEDAPSTAPKSTAEIVKQTLTQALTVSGDLGYGDTVEFGGLLNGIITGLPDDGDVIERGGELYSVDNSPVILFYGSLPAYRALDIGAQGADVKQFTKNLAKLGYGNDVDDEYTDATADAVKEWQKDLGLDQTGVVELGRVVYTPDKIRIVTVDTHLGKPAGGPVLSYSALDKVVTTEVDLDDQKLAAVDTQVTLTLPDGSETTGKVTDSTTTVKASGPDQEERETVLVVTVAPDDPSVFDDLDQASVDVAFPTDSAKNVLTVPVEALLGLVEGGFGLEVADGDTTEVITVETGLFADGYVEVSGKGLEEGMSVVVPS